MSLYNRSQLKHEFKTGTLSTEQKFSILIDSVYNRVEDSLMMGPLGYVGTPGLIGPVGGTHIGLFVGYGTDYLLGKVLIGEENIKFYGPNSQEPVVVLTEAGSSSRITTDTITLRFDALEGLTGNQLAGITINNINGSTSGGIYLNADGDLIYGINGELKEPLSLPTTLTDYIVPVWLSENKNFVDSNIHVDLETGFVGIGKTAANYTLDVSGNINLDGVFYQNGEIFVSSEWTKLPDNSIYYVDNVSIGTTVSSQRLTVDGNFSLSGAFFDSIGSSGVGGEVLVSTETGTNWKGLTEIFGVTGYGLTNYIVRWTDYDTIEPSSILDTNGTVTIGPSSITNLVINGTIQSNGTSLTLGTGIDQIMYYTKSLVLTTDWQDVGINGTDLETGTYIIQMYANDIWQSGSNNNEYYSGTMSWYAGEVSNPMELPTDEIPLHRSGGGADGGLYLRTYKHVPGGTPGYIKLQIYSNYSNTFVSNYVFKFRRFI